MSELKKLAEYAIQQSETFNKLHGSQTTSGLLAKAVLVLHEALEEYIGIPSPRLWKELSVFNAADIALAEAEKIASGK